MYPSPRSAAALALMWLGLAAPAFAAQSSAAPAARAHPPYAGEPSQIPANGKPIVLEVGKGTLIRLSRPASTVFVASPDIADVQIKSPELIYVSAKAPGQTVIYAVDGGDTVLLNAPVRVDFDLSELRQSLNRLVPGTRYLGHPSGFEPGAERRRRQCRTSGKGPRAGRRRHRRGQGRPGDQSALGRDPEPGQSAGPHSPRSTATS